MKNIVLIYLLFVGLAATASNPAAIALKKGNEAYKNEQYEEAYNFYNDAILHDASSANICYNLGNAAYKTGRLAEAILNYERVLKYHPGHEDALFNLELCQKQLIDKIEISPSEQWSANWNRLLTSYGASVFGIIAIIAFFIAAIAFYLRSTQITFKKVGGVFFWIFLSLFGLTAILGYRSHRLISNYPYAIMTSPKIDVRTAPQNNANTAFVLHEGTKVKIHETDGDWLEISLPDGKTGWVSINQLEAI